MKIEWPSASLRLSASKPAATKRPRRDARSVNNPPAPLVGAWRVRILISILRPSVLRPSGRREQATRFPSRTASFGRVTLENLGRAVLFAHVGLQNRPGYLYLGPMYPNMSLVHSTWALCTQHGPFQRRFGTPGEVLEPPKPRKNNVKPRVL